MLYNAHAHAFEWNFNLLVGISVVEDVKCHMIKTLKCNNFLSKKGVNTDLTADRGEWKKHFVPILSILP